MSRPDPIQYAERLYSAIRAANFSPMSFLAFGNAVKDGVAMRSMPRIAAEPFMRIIGEMLDLEEEAAERGDIDVVVVDASTLAEPSAVQAAIMVNDQRGAAPAEVAPVVAPATPSTTPSDRKRNGGKR